MTPAEYLRCAKHFFAHLRLSPDNLGPDDLRRYLLHLVEDLHFSPANMKVHIAAIKFLYAVTLDRPEVVARVRLPKVPIKLLDIPSPTEVAAVLSELRSPVYRERHGSLPSHGLRCRLAPTLSTLRRSPRFTYDSPLRDPSTSATTPAMTTNRLQRSTHLSSTMLLYEPPSATSHAYACSSPIRHPDRATARLRCLDRMEPPPIIDANATSIAYPPPPEPAFQLRGLQYHAGRGAAANTAPLGAAVCSAA